MPASVSCLKHGSMEPADGDFGTEHHGDDSGLAAWAAQTVDDLWHSVQYETAQACDALASLGSWS